MCNFMVINISDSCPQSRREKILHKKVQSWKIQNFFLLKLLHNFCAFSEMWVETRNNKVSNSKTQDNDPQIDKYSGPEVINNFSYSTQLSTKFILRINVKMPTTVGILTLISMINTTYERLKARNFFNCWYFSFYEQLKFRTQLSWAWKKFFNLGGAWPPVKINFLFLNQNIFCENWKELIC